MENNQFENPEFEPLPPRAKKTRVAKELPDLDSGRSNSKYSKQREDISALRPESSEPVYDPDAPASGGRFKGFNIGGDLGKQVIISLIAALIVVVLVTSVFMPMVGKKTYTADITRLENDLVAIRGGVATGTSLATLQASINSVSAAQSKFLVQGNLDKYALSSEVTSAINALKKDIPSTDAVASSLTSTINTKLATVDTKLALIDSTLATLGNGTYVTKTELATAIIYLRSLIGQGSGTQVNYTAYGTGNAYLFLIGPVVGNHTSVEVDFVFPQVTATKLGTASVNAFLSSIATPPIGETFAPTYTPSGSNIYLTSLIVVLTAPNSTQGYWVVQLPNVDQLGAPTSVVIKTQP